MNRIDKIIFHLKHDHLLFCFKRGCHYIGWEGLFNLSFGYSGKAVYISLHPIGYIRIGKGSRIERNHYKISRG